MGKICTKCHFENPDDALYCGNCATPVASPEEILAFTAETKEVPKKELASGSTFAGRYQIIEKLGKGGMGKVYRAIDKKLNEEVAIKLLKHEISSDKKTIQRFSNELKLARKVSHRNVGRMYELMEHDGKYYITMEYVSGEDLKSFIKRAAPLSFGKSVSIAKQVCKGLSEAHRLGVVHRDLKPHNIMIDKEGNARILDFGIARSLKTKGITGPGILVGTPEYMSPEQAEAKEVDHRSDIYSLGVILYEMITGKLPFLGDTPLSTAVKHKREMPKDPRELNSQIPEDLSRVILKCMEKKKEKRHQNVEELLSDLIKIEKGTPFIDMIRLESQPGEEPVTGPTWKNSIAVLPFSDLSPQKDQEYFCDGMAEEIINALAHIKDLRVVARTSAFSFKGEKVDVREIGKKLNVDTVLEGSIRKADNRIRITAQLINVADGFHIWSERYDLELEDVFTIQDKVTLAIVGKLKLKLISEEKEKLIKHHTDNLEAYNSFSKGRFFWNKRTDVGLKKAIEYFEQAIQKDPSYALAYAGLADSYIVLPEYSSTAPKDAHPKAREAALKALEIDDSLAEAHASLAAYKMFFQHEWDEAEKEYRRAIELNPSYATAHYWYGLCMLCRARFDEAIEQIKQALELDPVSLIIHAGLGWAFCYARQYEEGIKVLQKTIEMEPGFSLLHLFLGTAYWHKEMYKDALIEFQKERELSSVFNPIAEAWIEMTSRKLGKKGQAKKVLDELSDRSKKSYVPRFYMACLSLSIGDVDQSFKWLEEAYESRDFWLSFVKVDPFFDNVRSDPRFKTLLNKVGLEK